MTEAGKKTRRALELYRVQLRAVRSQREKVAELRKSICGVQTLSGIRCKGGEPKGIEQKIFKLSDENKKLGTMELYLRVRRAVVEYYLDSISDPMTRIIFYLRYMDGLSWVSIAVRHGGGATPDAMRMVTIRYMDAHPLKYFLKN